MHVWRGIKSGMKISCGVKVEENEEEAEEDWLWGWERDRDWMSWTREVR